ncbi:MAG TPA: hypothetical protein VNR40_08060, partial [Steroidobacter sp.]|nr:hypothetical protein [Steroidobacter sp.]
GVDDYLSKRAPDAKVVAAIRAAFRAVEMRRAIHAVWQQQGAGIVSDVASGVLADRLRAEVKRAVRYGRNLSILVIQLESDSGAPVTADTMAQAVRVVSDSIRVDIDFATRYRGRDGTQRIAVVLPETNGSGAAGLGGRLSATLAARLLTPLDSFSARVGCASFTPGQETGPSQQIAASIEALLREAEASTRVAPGFSASQRRAETG